MEYRLTRHAQEEMHQRGIPLVFVESVLNHPQQVISERKGRKAYQSQIDFGGGRIFLLRVIVIDDVDPAIVITVYRTSKIEKYWRQL